MQTMKQQTLEKTMRLMISLLTAGFLVACGDKEAEDTATEEVVEDSAVEEVEEGSEGEGEESQESEEEGEE